MYIIDPDSTRDYHCATCWKVLNGTIFYTVMTEDKVFKCIWIFCHDTCFNWFKKRYADAFNLNVIELRVMLEKGYSLKENGKAVCKINEEQKKKLMSGK